LSIRPIRRPAAFAAALACLALGGCATFDRTKPAPAQAGPIAIRISNDTLGMNDLPLGAYRVPDSQVIVSGRQSPTAGGIGMMFGLVGVLVADAVETHRTANAVSDAEKVLHIRLDGELRADLAAQVADPAFKNRYTLGQPGGATLEILPALVLTYTDDTHVRPFVDLKVRLLDRSGAEAWSTRYFASTGYDRTMDGPGGWAEHDGAALKASVSASLRQAVKVMLADVATPYARDEKKRFAVATAIPFVHQRFQLVGMDLAEDDQYIAFLPHVGDASVMSGVNVLDKRVVVLRPATDKDAVLALGVAASPPPAGEQAVPPPVVAAAAASVPAAPPVVPLAAPPVVAAAAPAAVVPAAPAAATVAAPAVTAPLAAAPVAAAPAVAAPPIATPVVAAAPIVAAPTVAAPLAATPVAAAPVAAAPVTAAPVTAVPAAAVPAAPAAAAIAPVAAPAAATARGTAAAATPPTPAVTAAPAAPAPSPAPATAVAAAATPAIPAVASTSPHHPDGARHLDSMMLQGRTLVYAHPTHPERYGDVRLTFVDDHVDASNRVSRTHGYYHVVDDQLCVSLEAWGPTCLYVVDGGEPASSQGMRALFEPSGHVSPLRLE
jgi:hypothetical protein